MAEIWNQKSIGIKILQFDALFSGIAAWKVVENGAFVHTNYINFLHVLLSFYFHSYTILKQ